MNKVRVIESAFVARIAAWWLKLPSAAIVFGSSIFIYGTSKVAFLQNTKWLRHELQHVVQYQRYGFSGFVGRYIIYHIRYGYINNPLEVEARAAETNESLHDRFQIS
ncbi:hypothetical protein CAP35_00635 [Chitinophagaceae bacterium IBVUCB1]|nr:hypothetical protein CAP35_00635 [Chitinophagaceae bacterium IBVUCB1]